MLHCRQAQPDVPAALTQAVQTGLLVWGGIVNGQPVLEPAFEVGTQPSLPARGGEYSLEGSAADGSGSSASPAEEVVDEIKRRGGTAVANF